jgi:hypothetical protein
VSHNLEFDVDRDGSRVIAHTCVESTVRYAAELGYEVTLVKDALEVNIPKLRPRHRDSTRYSRLDFFALSACKTHKNALSLKRRTLW